MCLDYGLPSFDSSSYQQVPLSKTDFAIRLVKLHPARTSDADIVIDLTLFDDDNAAYEAVSWCWGTGDWTRPIRVRLGDGDKCLKVSSNLESALRHLRLMDKYKVLWIDAICIDQSDAAEKSRQVPLMSEIYGTAMRVCVWLGDEDATTSKAINFMRNEVLNLQHFDHLVVDDQYGDSWMALIQFMEKPWFSRRWVIQEIALGDQRTAIIVCGKYSITWADFVEAVSLFDRALSGPLNLSRLQFPQIENVSYNNRYAPALGAIRLVKASNDLLRESHYRDNKLVPIHSLEYLVSTFTMYQTSEPRDVIFSLLSISKDAFRLDDWRDDEATTLRRAQPTVFDHLPTASKVIKNWMDHHIVRRAFKVDYDAPVVEIYKRFISFAIGEASAIRALDIICRPWAPELKNFEFPSWICTLSQGSYKLVDQNSLGQRLVRRNPDPLVGTPDRPNYNASRNLGPSETHIFRYWSSVNRSMFLRGFVLDEVGALEFPSQLGHIPPEWPTMGNWDPKHGDPPEEFWRTLVADRGPDGQDPLPFYPRACKNVFQHAVDDTLDTSMLINHGSSIIADFLKRVQAVIWNRRLMRTKRLWLGLAPKGACPDDLICILYGCSVPVILRRVLKSEKDIEEELQDDQERRTNATVYIARRLAEYARRKRNAKDDVDGTSDNKTNKSHDNKKMHSKETGPKEVSKTAASREDENISNEPASGGTDNGLKRQWSDSMTGSMAGGIADPKRAKIPDTTRKADMSKPKPFYYTLVGECYVHGMMNGEAISFRIRSRGNDNRDRILNQTFELR